MRKILIDFDGTIINHKSVPTRVKWWLDKPKKNSLETLIKMQNDNDLVIFTSRLESDFPIINSWLYKYGFPILRITNIKEKADVYIDDRAYRFTNWLDISKLW